MFIIGLLCTTCGVELISIMALSFCPRILLGSLIAKLDFSSRVTLLTAIIITLITTTYTWNLWCCLNYFFMNHHHQLCTFHCWVGLGDLQAEPLRISNFTRSIELLDSFPSTIRLLVNFMCIFFIWISKDSELQLIARSSAWEAIGQTSIPSGF